MEEPKYKLGFVLEGYKTNLHQEKYNLGEQFFGFVNGNAFRTNSERTIILNEKIAELNDKHFGWDNFHHEAPVAAAISSYIPDQQSIIPSIAFQLFKTVLICRIGRGTSYNYGVSPRGKPYYDSVLSVAGDVYTPMILTLFDQFEIKALLSRDICRAQAVEALIAVRTNVISPRIQECLDWLIAKLPTESSCVQSNEFKRLSSTFINW